MERIDFVGRTFFVPVFLIATGMLIDLQVLWDPRTLLVGGAFTAVAIVAKLLAAVAGGRLAGYTRDEIGAMFALSTAQAAATLAAIIVGLEVGLLDEETVNAVMLVILVTCVLASVAAGRYAPRLPVPEVARDPGERVVVPVANPTTAPLLMRLASAFARADGGLVVPVTVVPTGADREELDRARLLEQDVIAVAQSAGAEARSVLRIDRTPELGIAHTVLEQQGSMLVLGWKGGTGRPGALFGGITDAVLSWTFVPTVIVREGGGKPTRVLVAVDGSVTAPAGHAALRLAVCAATVVAQRAGVPVEVVANAPSEELTRLVALELHSDVVVDERRRSSIVGDRARSTDLVVVPCLADEAHLRAVATRLVPALPQEASVLVCVDNSMADPRVRRSEVTDPARDTVAGTPIG